MMKRFFLFFVIFFVIFSEGKNLVFSYDINHFYSTISENIDEYDTMIFSTDVEGKDGIASELNKITKKNPLIKNECFTESISLKDIESALPIKNEKGGVGDPRLDILHEKLKPECKLGEGISVSINTELLQILDTFYTKHKAEAEEKSQTINNLVQSSVYADGDLKNSPFDLIDDIEQIDEIIFERTQEIEYKPSKNTNLGDILKKKLKEKIKDNAKKKLKKIVEEKTKICKLNGTCDTNEYKNKLIEKIKNEQKNPNIFQTVISKQQCPVDTSGLNDITQTILKNSIDSKLGNKSIHLGKDGSYNIKNGKNKPIKIKTNYKGENDNSLFPCNDFFCVKVKFNTYNHNLLGGWARKTPSIEFLLKRANNHLKPLVAGSLVQSKMTLNNFELSLKDLNLAERFHMGVQISSKPVPILNLQKDFSSKSDKEGRPEKPVYALENQLKEYYTAEGLDFEQLNDLSFITDAKANTTSTSNALGLSPNAVIQDINSFEKNKQNNTKKIAVIKEKIQEKLKNTGINYLDNQYKEIEVMNQSVREYIDSLDKILSAYLKTPVDPGTN